jgi:hypothetical protein
MLSGNLLGERDHVETGDDEAVDENERHALAGRSSAASAVEGSAIHWRPTALQTRGGRQAEIAQELRQHQSEAAAGEAVQALLAIQSDAAC